MKNLKYCIIFLAVTMTAQTHAAAEENGLFSKIGSALQSAWTTIRHLTPASRVDAQINKINSLHTASQKLVTTIQNRNPNLVSTHTDNVQKLFTDLDRKKNEAEHLYTQWSEDIDKNTTIEHNVNALAKDIETLHDQIANADTIVNLKKTIKDTYGTLQQNKVAMDVMNTEVQKIQDNINKLKNGTNPADAADAIVQTIRDFNDAYVTLNAKMNKITEQNQHIDSLDLDQLTTLHQTIDLANNDVFKVQQAKSLIDQTMTDNSLKVPQSATPPVQPPIQPAAPAGGAPNPAPVQPIIQPGPGAGAPITAPARDIVRQKVNDVINQKAISWSKRNLVYNNPVNQLRVGKKLSTDATNGITLEKINLTSTTITTASQNIKFDTQYFPKTNTSYTLTNCSFETPNLQNEINTIRTDAVSDINRQFTALAQLPKNMRVDDTNIENIMTTFRQNVIAIRDHYVKDYTNKSKEKSSNTDMLNQIVTSLQKITSLPDPKDDYENGNHINKLKTLRDSVANYIQYASELMVLNKMVITALDKTIDADMIKKLTAENDTLSATIGKQKDATTATLYGQYNRINKALPTIKASAAYRTGTAAINGIRNWATLKKVLIIGVVITIGALIIDLLTGPTD